MLQLQTKTTHIEAVRQLEDVTINYRYSIDESGKASSLFADARTPEVGTVLSMTTTDGENFNGSFTLKQNEVNTEIIEQMKSDLAELLINPLK